VTDLLSQVVQIIELVAAVIVIVTAIVFLLALREVVKDRKQTAKVRPESKPAARLTLREQLLKPSARPYCYVNGEEVRRLYTRTLSKPIPHHTSVRAGERQESTLEGGPPVLKASSTRSSDHEVGAQYEPPSDEELAEELIQALVQDNKVAFGVESGLPDRAKIDAFDEGQRRLAQSGLDLQPMAKWFLEHRKMLDSGGLTSPEAKTKEIDEIHAKYHYIAMKADFVCHPDQSSPTVQSQTTAAGGVSVASLGIEVSSVNIQVALPAEKVKEEMRFMFANGRRLDDMMVFGTIIGWTKQNPPTLTVTPLAVALSWTET
jgi:hypothetical protein